MPGRDTTGAFLASLTDSVKHDFLLKKRVLSFPEYFELFKSRPRWHARSAAQYLLDCFRYFGVEGDRFGLFDVPFEDGRDRLAGQEAAQQGVFKAVSRFVRQGKVDHLVLLYGPNGSSKSTLVNCIFKALEFYSSTDEGALYRFQWVFPLESAMRKGLGFGGSESPRPASYAYLDESEVSTKIGSGMKDHPLFLIPKKQRAELLEKLVGGDEFRPARTIVEGDLSPMCRLVFDSLLTAYQGDLDKVLQHVQVERFFLSSRFRRGLVTVEPQLQVDAGLRQITLNRSLESLPKVLQSVTLFEPFGDLVDGNRGMVEFNDLLKRPLDAFKYLLATCEKSTVTLPSAILFLDTVFIASSNDRYLKAFMELPEWPSFKGRIELVRVPYLLDYTKEARIYEEQVDENAVGKHIAPHAMETAALFAVLTRLRKPGVDALPDAIRETMGKLGPLEKADLYAHGKVPDWVDSEAATHLVTELDAVRNEGASQSPYEGEVGASPREIKNALFEAAMDDAYACLSPTAVLAVLEKLVQERPVYEFLRIEPDGEYHDAAAMIGKVRTRYLEWADEDVRTSMGLVSEAQYRELMARYATHANLVMRKEKVQNPVTGKLEEPDTSFLEEMEQMMSVEDSDSFRSEVIAAIGAWSLDNPGKPVPYSFLFRTQIQKLREAYFKKHASEIHRVGRLVLDWLAGERGSLVARDKRKVEQVVASLEQRGYCTKCAAELLSCVLRERYGGDR